MPLDQWFQTAFLEGHLLITWLPDPGNQQEGGQGELENMQNCSPWGIQFETPALD